MRWCDCEQCRLWTAHQRDDRSLIEHAFSLLDSDAPGHYDNYGDSYAGAGDCYILRVGSEDNTRRLARRIKQDEPVRRRIVGGLWHEYALSHKLIARIFELSDYDQRFDILVALDIRDSEKADVSGLLRLLLPLDLKPWEDTLLHQTQAHRNWA